MSAGLVVLDMPMMRLILASASPRRRQLIALLGHPVAIVPADVDEAQITDPDPAANVIATAGLKADTVVRRLRTQGEATDTLVIGADTTVVLEGRMLGKPADAPAARAMLRSLRGQVHQVLTGLAVIQAESGRLVTDLCRVDVPMRAYTEAEIASYVASGDPLDKAGAYAIQHPGFRPVASLTGCYAGVVGLPLCHLARSLRRFGLTPAANLAPACQVKLAYDCPIHATVLAGAPDSASTLDF